MYTQDALSLSKADDSGPADISLREELTSNRCPTPDRRSIDTAASVRLDMVRGIAAIAVMIGHVRALFFPAYAELVNPSLPNRALYAITGFGHQAVIVFFVLSGYFIGASVLRMVKNGRWSWRVYLIHRAVRLWVVLVPALILGAIFDYIGMRTQNAASTYFAPVRFLSNVAFASRFTIKNFFGNLFYLQTIRTEMFGSNGPLWSLSYEFWYYVVFPLSFFALVTMKRRPIRVLLGLAAGGVLWFVGLPIAVDYLIWLAGVGVFFVSGEWRVSDRLERNAVQALSWVIFIGSLVWIRLRKEEFERASDFVLAGTFSAWMFACILPTYRKIGPLYESLARNLAGLSYTLYLTHFPLLALLRAILNPSGFWPADIWHWALAVVLAVGCLGFAFLVASFTEKKTAAVRAFVLSRVTL